MSATPSADTGTDSPNVKPDGMKLRDTRASSGLGPRSRPLISVVASCSPRGTKTGSGTRIWAVGSKK